MPQLSIANLLPSSIKLRLQYLCPQLVVPVKNIEPLFIPIQRLKEWKWNDCNSVVIIWSRNDGCLQKKKRNTGEPPATRRQGEALAWTARPPAGLGCRSATISVVPSARSATHRCSLLVFISLSLSLSLHQCSVSLGYTIHITCWIIHPFLLSVAFYWFWCGRRNFPQPLTIRKSSWSGGWWIRKKCLCVCSVGGGGVPPLPERFAVYGYSTELTYRKERKTPFAAGERCTPFLLRKTDFETQFQRPEKLRNKSGGTFYWHGSKAQNRLRFWSTWHVDRSL